MALMESSTIRLKFPTCRGGNSSPRVNSNVSMGKFTIWTNFPILWGGTYKRISPFPGRELGRLCSCLLAFGSGLEASISAPKKNDISLGNVKVVIESRDEDKIHVRVNLTGDQTQRAFEEVLTNLATTAPPIPGFRRMKGGKTSKVPKSFLLQILGKDRATKFLIQEIVSISMSDYVRKENLKVNNQFKTVQTADDLESGFIPGSEFGFNATMEIEKSDLETTSSESS